MEKRSHQITPAIEAEARADGEKKRISGHASVFYDGSAETEFELWPGVYERVMPTAFDRALAERDDVVALVNHDDSLLLGRTKAGTLRLAKDKRGLRYEVDPPDTTIGRDTLISLDRGDLDGASFAFKVSPSGERWFRDGDREIREIHTVDRLFDVSVVLYGAYSGASSGVRSCSELAEARAAHKAWRDTEKAETAEPPTPDDDFDFRLATERQRLIA